MPHRGGAGLQPHLLALVFATVLGAIVTSAEPVRIAFVARVHNVYDPGDALHDTIAVGDLLHGTLTYDPSALDVDRSPTVDGMSSGVRHPV